MQFLTNLFYIFRGFLHLSKINNNSNFNIADNINTGGMTFIMPPAFRTNLRWSLLFYLMTLPPFSVPELISY